MEKICIFCGQKTEKKNKEHILPKWLLELTGDPKRITRIGHDWSTGQLLSFSYDSLVFPSCESCNSRYSVLEDKAKGIIENIFNYGYLDTNETTLLLDWFDKLRVGLWLGYQYLSNNAFGVKPQYHIDQRIREKDRFLIINDLNNYNKGLTLIGVNTPFFHYNPICFTIVINNKVFTNVSTDFIVAHDLGFPYPKVGYLSSESRMIDYQLLPGKLKLNKKLLRLPVLRPSAIIGQPIVNLRMVQSNMLYSEDYVKARWQDGQLGVGNVFIEINGALEWIDENEEFQIDFRSDIPGGPLRVDIQTFRIQNYILDYSVVSDERLTEEHKSNFRRLHKLVREFNSNAITRLKKSTKEELDKGI